MLQISQTENPICSATIDQIRLRRATVLPLEFQNVSSSGFHSEIHVVFGSLIAGFLVLKRSSVAKPVPNLWPRKIAGFAVLQPAIARLEGATAQLCAMHNLWPLCDGNEQICPAKFNRP